LLLEVLDDLPGRLERARPQDGEQACYADKISKHEAHIDWSRGAAALDRTIRAFNPFPGCYSNLEGERVKIWQAQPLKGPAGPIKPGTILKADRQGVLVSCGDGQLLLQYLQFPGGKILAAEQILNAGRATIAPGRQFDSQSTDDS
jgi:methionyl-tRNA formyltransferase